MIRITRTAATAIATAAITGLAVSGCGASDSGQISTQPTPSTTQGGDAAALHSREVVKQRLASAGIPVRDESPKSARGPRPVAELIAGTKSDSSTADHVVIAFFPTSTDADAYQVPLQPGVAAGRGLAQGSGNRVYLITASGNGLTMAERKLFQRVIAAGEGGA